MTARWMLGRVERDSYAVARTAGDLRAARRGPAPVARRLARRTFTRALFRALRTTR